MRTSLTSLLLLALSLFVLAACGGDSANRPMHDQLNPPTETTAEAPAEAPTEAEPAEEPAPAAEVPPYEGPAFEATITPVGNLMEYEQKEITVHPGQTVRLTFQNTADNPAMSHNIVILEQGASPNEIGQAAMNASDNDYIPPAYADQIVAYTAMAGPGETVSVEFTAPAEGEYTYICTFPGHYMVMQGTMRVVAA